MKPIILLLTLIISLLVSNVKAQIKLNSYGNVALGSSTIQPGFYVTLYGRYFYIGTTYYSTAGMMKIDCGNANPRIWSPSGAIVFYNNDIADYQNIQVKTCYQYSDISAKTNINTLSNGLTTVKKLRGVTFNWKNDVSNPNAAQSQSPKLDYGLIAQEVEKVVPDLVLTNDSTQGKMLSYTGIIPILIEAIKDLSAQVDDQKKQIDALKSTGSNLKSAQVATESKSTSASVATLSQNAPNPFNQTTEIGYYLPDATQSAVLYIYNMNGLQIKAIPIQNKGNGSVTINGSELMPGMYIYTLIVDGQEIDTKRMILTQ